MVLKDFKFSGSFPNFVVKAVLSEDDSENQESSQELSIGAWGYVSTLTEKELTSLIHQTYQAHQEPEPTESMKKLIGHKLSSGSKSDKSSSKPSNP